MKFFKQIMSIVIASLILAACTTTSTKELDEKYIFPDLKQVDRVFSHRIDGWGEIDKQSLFISTSPSTSYLIILRRPSNDIRFARKMGFSTSGSSLDAKFDRIYFYSSLDSIEPIPAFIDRIYEVKGKEQKKMIRAKITGQDTGIEKTLKENDPEK